MKYFTLLFVAVLFSSGVSAQITNPGFESGSGVGWAEVSTNEYDLLCSEANCGVNFAYQGNWYVWLGGAGEGVDEVSAISQTITVPSGSDAVLYFYMVIPPFGDQNSMTVDPISVSLDGTPLLTLGAQDSTLFYDAEEDDYFYSIQYFDVTDFADGGSYELIVAGDFSGGASVFFDSFDLEVDGVSTGLFDLQMNGERTFALYPNPANDAINLSFGHDLQYGAIVRILDMNGRVVSQESIGQISNRTFSMDTQWMTAGLYTLEVVNGGERMTERFAVAH